MERILSSSLFPVGRQQPNVERPGRIHMHIPLGKCNYNIGLVKQGVDSKADAAFDLPAFDDPMDRNPELDLEDEGIVAEIFEDDEGFRRFHDFFIFPDTLQQEGFNLAYR